jgi:hypothetical protein
LVCADGSSARDWAAEEDKVRNEWAPNLTEFVVVARDGDESDASREGSVERIILTSPEELENGEIFVW